MDQTVINWGFAALSGILGFLLNMLWQAIKDLQSADKLISEKISSIEVVVAGNYVKKDEFDRTITRLFQKLDLIVEQVSNKADR